MNAWVVRSGGTNEPDVSQLFEEHSAAAIDWQDWFSDLSQSSREEIKAMAQAHGQNTHGAGAVAGEIFSFVNGIIKGDLVITPPTADRGNVLVGYCEDPYKYTPGLIVADNPKHYSHVIRVNWVARFPRSKFPSNVVKVRKTVYSVTNHMDEILTIIKSAARSDVNPGTEIPATSAATQVPWSSADTAEVAKELLWEPEQLQEIIDDLQEKRQVIFYGPPGTGKTYVASAIAKHCREHGGDFEIVQFHPSYLYEDFVQGYRPRLIEGQPGFKLVDGPLLRIAKRAEDSPDATFILVIDELNRGNVATVFGELYFLLEYREEEMRLQYSGDDKKGFRLPENLWFICTMNTADRNIALMDAALRRRFYFAPFFSNEPPIEGLLRRWIGKHNQGSEWVADLVDLANGKLERDMGIGPSYFMDPYRPLDEDRVRRIWKRAIIPYLEEQCFGDTEKLRGFEFDRLKQQLGGVLAITEETKPVQASDANPNAA